MVGARVGIAMMGCGGCSDLDGGGSVSRFFTAVVAVVLMCCAATSNALFTARVLSSGDAFVVGCDSNTTPFVASFCSNLDLSQMCRNVGGANFFLHEQAPCELFAGAMSQAAQQINSSIPTFSCENLDASGALGPRSWTLHVPPVSDSASFVIALNAALSGNGGFNAANVDCHPATTAAPTASIPTRSPATSIPTAAPVESRAPTAAPTPVPLCHGQADRPVCERLTAQDCISGSLESQQSVQNDCKILCNTCPATGAPSSPPTRIPTGICIGDPSISGDESFDPQFCRAFGAENCSTGELGADLREHCRVLCATCPTVAPTNAPSRAPTTPIPSSEPTTLQPTFEPTAVGDEDLLTSIAYYSALGGQAGTKQSFLEWVAPNARFCANLESAGECMSRSTSCQIRGQQIRDEAPVLWIARGAIICRHICQFTCANATAAPTGGPSISPTTSPTVSPTASPTYSPTLSPTESAPPSHSPTASPTQSPSFAADIQCTNIGDSQSSRHITTVDDFSRCQDSSSHLENVILICTGVEVDITCTQNPESSAMMFARRDAPCGAGPLNQIIERVGYLSDGSGAVLCDANGFFTASTQQCDSMVGILTVAIDLAARNELDGCNFTTPSTTPTSTATSSASSTATTTVKTSPSSTASTTASSTQQTTASSTYSSTQTFSDTSTMTSSASTSETSTVTTSVTSTVTSTVTTSYFGRVECTQANSDIVFATSVGGAPRGPTVCGGGSTDTAALLTNALRICSRNNQLSVSCRAVDTDNGRVEVLTAGSEQSCPDTVLALSSHSTAILASHTGDTLQPTLCGSLGTLRSENTSTCRDTAIAMNSVVDYMNSASGTTPSCAEIRELGALPTSTVTTTVTTTPVPDQLECGVVNGLYYVHISQTYANRCGEQASALNEMIRSCTGTIGSVSCAQAVRFDNNREFFTFTGGIGLACETTVAALNRIIGVHGFEPDGELICDGTNIIRVRNEYSCNYDTGILNEALESYARNRFVSCGNRTSPSTTVTSTLSSTASSTLSSTATTTASSTQITTRTSTATSSASTSVTTSITSSATSSASSTATSSLSSSATSSQSTTVTSTVTTSAHYDGRIRCTEARGGDVLLEVGLGACAAVAAELNSILQRCGLGSTNLLRCANVVGADANRTTLNALAVSPSGCSRTTNEFEDMIEDVGFKDERNGGLSCTLTGLIRHENSTSYPCAYTRDILVEILTINEVTPWQRCPIRASATSTATSTASSSATSSVTSSASTTYSSTGTSTVSTTASTTASSTVFSSTATSTVSSSASTSASSTETTTLTSSLTSTDSTSASTSATSTVTTTFEPQVTCRSSRDPGVTRPQGLLVGGQSPEACRDHALVLNELFNDCINSENRIFIDCAGLDNSRRSQRQIVPQTAAPTMAPTQLALNSTTLLHIHSSVSFPAQVLTMINRMLREVDTNGICSQRGTCTVALYRGRYLKAGDSANGCGTTATILNAAFTAGLSGIIQNCEFSTASTTVSSTATSSVTSTATTTPSTEEWSSASSTLTSTATSSITSSATTTLSTTASTTASTTVTTQFDDSLAYSCEDTGSVLVSLLTTSRHGIHCNRHSDTLNTLLGWCNPNDPDLPLDGGAALQVTLGVRGNLTCTSRNAFYISSDSGCQRHADILGNIILRGYSNVVAPPTCINGTLTIDSDHCGAFATALNEITNKLVFDPQDPVVRGCSSFPFTTLSPRPDSDATYTFKFVQDDQFASFLSQRFSTTSVSASLRLQISAAASIPTARVEIVSFLNTGQVNTLILARTRNEEPHTADLLIQMDDAVSSPFLFNYSGRTLTTVIPGTGRNGDIESADSSSSDGSDSAMIAVIVVLIVIIVAVAIVVYLRDAKKKKAENVTKEEPVSMISIDGKPYWRDDMTEKSAPVPGVEESAIDDMLNPRRTTLEYHNPMAYSAAAAVTQPEGLAGFDYIIRSTRPVMPFTFPTAFPVAQLGHRPVPAQRHEYAEVDSLTKSYNPNPVNYKFIDDYNLPRGIVASHTKVPWDIVWQSDCTVVAIMPSLDEVGHILPVTGESIVSEDISVINRGTAMLTETLSCANLSLTNQLSGEERMVQALQLAKWDPTEHSAEQDLIDMLIAAKQSHYANDCAPAVVFDVEGKGHPSSGAFVLGWICVKSALDTGFVDLARTSLLLRAQEKLLVRDEEEYMMVHSMLNKMLVTIPSMQDAHMTQAQQLTKVCLQTWHATMQAQVRSDTSAGYIDISAVPDIAAIGSGGSGYLETSAPPSASAQKAMQHVQETSFSGFPDLGVPQFDPPAAAAPAHTTQGKPAWRTHA